MPETRITANEERKTYLVLHCPKCFGEWTVEEADDDFYKPPIRPKVTCPFCKTIVNATVEGW